MTRTAFRPTPDQLSALSHAQQNTLAALAELEAQTLVELSQLTLPEIQEIQQEIAQILPAGNLPAFILSGLLQFKGRRITPERVQQDLNALLRGIGLLPQGLYSVFVAGPAAILYAYQKLLQLAGKNMDSAFPQGTWQFYLQFGLREDSARHANETIGFHQRYPKRDVVAEAAAWVYAAMETIYSYDDLLATDWRERVMLRVTQEEVEAAGVDTPQIRSLVRDWNQARPYHRPPKRDDYLRYRLETFEIFMQDRLQSLPKDLQRQIQERVNEHRQQELQNYQQQMTILATLTPDQYQEHRELLPLRRAFVGFVHYGRTYLFPLCRRNAQGSPLCYLPDSEEEPLPLYTKPDGKLCDANGTSLVADRGGHVWYEESGKPLGNLRPPPLEEVYAIISAILNTSPEGVAPNLDMLLVETPRAMQTQLRSQLPPETQQDITLLRRTPVIINWDERPHDQPLAYVRQGRRGIGDHALTIFRTAHSTVFDQSHIFFDGIWGMAIAETLTDTALHRYAELADISPTPMIPSAPLQLQAPPELVKSAEKFRRPGEAAAESMKIDMEGLSQLRMWLKQRGVRLTVNDVLILYRTFHAANYDPAKPLTLNEDKLDLLYELDDPEHGLRSRANPAEYQTVREAINLSWNRGRETNPALLIPMDASNVSPQERLFPTTFRNPLVQLLPIFKETHELLHRYRESQAQEDWRHFDEKRRELLRHLEVFGEILDAVKAVTMRGESFNTATLRLLGHLPPAMQHILDQIPQRIGVLNEVMKGNEVFSNVGRVATGSWLRRFISAKDDGDTKELVWGVMSDDHGRMHISLRDFRPFVPMLLAMDESQLANKLAQHYLYTYVDGLNRFIARLSSIVGQQAPRPAEDV